MTQEQAMLDRQRLQDIEKKLLLLAGQFGYKFVGSDSSTGISLLPICKECGKCFM